MTQAIKIRDFNGVVQYADLEDLPNGTPPEMKSLRIVYGKLVKTSELGQFLDELYISGLTPTGLFTWIDPHLSASSAPVASGKGFMYLIATVNKSTKKLQLWGWNGSSLVWIAIDTAGGIVLTSGSYYQHEAASTEEVEDRPNPIIQTNDILRFLPGNTAKPDGTNVAVGAWIGWIGRDYFDGLYLATTYTAKFFSYAREISKPAFTPTFTQQSGDGVFSPSEDLAIVDMNDVQQTVTIAGTYSGVFRTGQTFTILENTANFGTFGISSAEVFGDLNQTKLWLDATQAIVDHIGGSVRITTARESRWYKFSYIYDGNQESLLSEARRIDFTDQKFLHCTLSITKTTHNKRITGINIYRSPNGNAGTYALIHTIDLLRKSGKFKSGTTGCHSGERWIYIPGMSGTVSGTNPAGVGAIKLWNSNTQGWWTYDTVSYDPDSARVLFGVGATGVPEDGDVKADDYWDCAWQYYKLGVGAAMTASGPSGAFAGQQVMIIGEDLGNYSYSGGALYFLVNSVATYRSTDTSYMKAVHLTAPVAAAGAGPSNGAYKLCRTEDGLFFTTDGTAVTFDFFDTGLPDGAAPPLEGEVSVTVNGSFAKMIAGMLFQANIVLDPAGKAESHPDWGSYSKLNQPDVTPVSNVLRFQEREGGALTGLEELFGMAVFTKKQAIMTVNCRSNPGTPELWTINESIHDIGNVAPLGMVKANDSLYPCAHDGIYRISPNNLSNVDGTPTAKLKITEPINNIYNAMTADQKRGIRAVYHPRRNEIHYFMTYSVADPLTYVYEDQRKRWAYNVITGAWREIYVLYDAYLTGRDENGNAFIVERPGEDGGLYAQIAAVETNQGAQDGRFTFRSKWFPISDDAPLPIHKIIVTYKSPHGLKLKLYLDGNDTMIEEYDLPAQADMKPYVLAIGYSCYRMQFVITDDIPETLVVEESGGVPVYLIVEQANVSPNVEIGGMDIIFDY